MLSGPGPLTLSTLYPLLSRSLPRKSCFQLSLSFSFFVIFRFFWAVCFKAELSHEIIIGRISYSWMSLVSPVPRSQILLLTAFLVLSSIKKEGGSTPFCKTWNYPCSDLDPYTTASSRRNCYSFRFSVLLLRIKIALFWHPKIQSTQNPLFWTLFALMHSVI